MRRWRRRWRRWWRGVKEEMCKKEDGGRGEDVGHV